MSVLSCQIRCFISMCATVSQAFNRQLVFCTGSYSTDHKANPSKVCLHTLNFIAPQTLLCHSHWWWWSDVHCHRAFTSRVRRVTHSVGTASFMALLCCLMNSCTGQFALLGRVSTYVCHVRHTYRYTVQCTTFDLPLIGLVDPPN